MQNISSVMLKFLTGALLGLFLTGCLYSAATTVNRASIVQRMENREQFETALAKSYEHYLEEAADSGCDASEYTVNPQVYDAIVSEGDQAMTETQEKMREVYRDKSYSEDSRAEALFYLALMNMGAAADNAYKAESYATQLKEEFPGKRDCIADWLLDRIVVQHPERYEEPGY